MRLLLALCVLLMLRLQLAAALHQSFWEDEAFSATLIEQPGAREVVQIVAERDIHPPLYLLTLYAWAGLFGDSELALRALSVALMIGVLLLVYALGAEVAGRRAAMFAIILLTCSPLVLLYGHNARYYAMSAALSLLATYAMLKYLHTDRRVFLLLYLLSSIALAYVVYTALVVIVACYLWYLIQSARRDAPRSRRRVWSMAHLLIPLAYLPWLGVLRSTVQAQGTTAATLAPMELLKRAGYVGFAFGVGETISPLNPIAWIGLALTIGLLAFALVRARSSRGAAMLAFFLFLILGANILINAFMAVPGFQNLPHRTLYAFPFFVLLLGYGISRLPPRMSLAACGILLLVYGTGIANYFSGQQFMKPVLAVPWRAIFTTIRASSPAGTMVVCNRVDFACPWYARRYGFGPRTPEAARKLAEEGYAQIWWIQSNRGAAFYDTTAEARLLEEISNGYQEHTVTSYALHDPSIRLLKRRFMRQQDDYDYRVNVYMLSEPVTPGDD